MVDSPAGRFTVTGESTTFETNTYNYNRFVSSFVYIHFLKLDLKLSATKKDWFEFIILNEMCIYMVNSPESSVGRFAGLGETTRRRIDHKPIKVP